MTITTLRKTATAIAILAGLFLFLTPPASAQIYGRGGITFSGEPTDPDGALEIVDSAELDLGDYGLATQEPGTETESQTWFEQLIELLRDLGLIADTGND